MSEARRCLPLRQVAEECVQRQIGLTVFVVMLQPRRSDRIVSLTQATIVSILGSCWAAGSNHAVENASNRETKRSHNCPKLRRFAQSIWSSSINCRGLSKCLCVDPNQVAPVRVTGATSGFAARPRRTKSSVDIIAGSQARRR